MKSMKKAFFFVLIGLSGLALKAQESPFYAEVCAATEIQKVGEGHANPVGHSVIFLHGICSDKDSAFPQLKNCDSSIDINAPDRGVGVSLDGSYQNVKWTGAEGKRFFLNGFISTFPADADDAQKINLQKQALSDTQAEVLRQGIYKGVTFVPGNFTPREGQTLEQAAAEYFTGTDYGISLARSLVCQRISVTSDMMQKMMGYLNDVNQKVNSGRMEYQWDVGDNCAHLVHNTIAAAGIWDKKKTGIVNPFRTKNPFKLIRNFGVTLRSFANIAVPTNEFLQAFDLVHKPETDPLQLFLNDSNREQIQKSDWISWQEGNLVEVFPATRLMDQYYVPSEEFFGLDKGAVGDQLVKLITFGKIGNSRIPHSIPKRVQFISKEGSYIDSNENLKVTLKKYQDAEADLYGEHSFENYRAADTFRRYPDFLKFLQDLEALYNRKIDKLSQMQNPDGV
ncbi:MAG: hypothetical protein ACXVAX_03145 [Pseudobdellovibrio sp.]